ncbi:MAG: hypothetical protein CW716_05875 [Candidatus Bathyarchaeum sp.]|nr:MAG: hypothetical protein CW716_05875 [Candidatus Bathyarchaeum sp.]
MSKEKMLITLTDLGLKKTEAKIYFYLAKEGPKKSKEITAALGITKQRFYPIIRGLQNKGIVSATLDRPAKFVAIPFDKLLDLFAKTKMEDAKTIKQNTGKLIADWQSISLSGLKTSLPKFAIIKGKKYVYSKIQQMIQETTNQFSVISNLSELFRAEQFGVLDSILNHPKKLQINFRLITEIPKHQLSAIKRFLEDVNPELKLKSRNADIGLSPFPKMVLRDNKEVLYFLSPRTGDLEVQNGYVCLFTNATSIADLLSSVFEEIWRNSTDINQKIRELETGVSPQRTEIIEDENLAITKFNEILQTAKEEIVMVTSSEDILSYWHDSSCLKKLTSNGVAVKIMAPISRENLRACLQLADFCEVRHVPNDYLKTITIDGKHFFQFNLKHAIKSQGSLGTYERTLYSNDLEYVQKTNKMLFELWKNSVVPTSSTVEAIIKKQASMSEDLFERGRKLKKYKFIDRLSTVSELTTIADKAKITEQDVRDKILSYKTSSTRRNSDVITACATTGHALIHPHTNFDYPKLLLSVYKIDKESTFGAEDAIILHSWLNTPIGYCYVPVAVAANNPKASHVWFARFKGSPVTANNNYNLFKKSELQIQFHGKTLFVAWTKPISLLSNQDPLPPSVLILEGTGQTKTRAYDVLQHNGVKDINQLNYCDAYITFIHQETKYQGPATDGLLAKDVYVETTFL